MVIKSFSALFFIVFLLLGFVVSIFSMLSTNFTDANLFNGRFTAQYETEYDQNLIHRSTSINFLNEINFNIFNEGRKGVIIGDEGWLFTDEEFLLPENYKNNIKANQNYIAYVKNKLDDQGIKLFVIPVPAKARLFKNKLGRYEYPKEWNNRYASLLNFLNKENIQHNIDLETSLSNTKTFLKYDTHWTPEGARAVAMNTALYIEKAFPYLSWVNENFKSEKLDAVDHKGDLTRYTANEIENINLWQTTSAEEEDLFNDKNYPIVLVGTSYSANSLWNFDGFLKEGLGADILNMADEGLGPFQVMKKYLTSESYKKNKPKLIIWEMPERYLPIKSQE